MDRSTYRNTKDIVKESWAVGVAYWTSKYIYGNIIYDWQSITFDKIVNPKYLEGKYTPLVIDLIDDENQRATHLNNEDYPTDSVSGYKLSQIEDALKGAKTLEKWRDNLKIKYNNTEEFLDELFDNYIDL